MKPAPHRHALLMSPCGRRAGVVVGLDPTTGPALLHPVTEWHPFFSGHFAVAVGFRKLQPAHLPHEDHAAPSRPCPVRGLGAPAIRRRTEDLEPDVRLRRHLQYLDRSREDRGGGSIAVLCRDDIAQCVLQDRSRRRLPRRARSLGPGGIWRPQAQPEQQCESRYVSSSTHSFPLLRTTEVYVRLRQAARHTPPPTRPPRPIPEDLEALVFSEGCLELTIRKNATVSNDHA
jgi:hypothetical protein